MQKVLDKEEPNNMFMVEVTPEQLRIIASRIEQKMKITFPGQTTTIPFTDNIILYSHNRGDS